MRNKGTGVHDKGTRLCFFVTDVGSFISGECFKGTCVRSFESGECSFIRGECSFVTHGHCLITFYGSAGAGWRRGVAGA